MTQMSQPRGLIRMALMGTAFIALTVVLIVFQPGSPRNKSSIPVMEDPSVTRVATQETDVVAASAPVALDDPTPEGAPASTRPFTPTQSTDPANVRDLTFAAISNLRSATTGEAPAPGQPGSLLHSVVQRSLGATPGPTVTNERITPITETATSPIRRPNSGSYFVRPGDTLMSIAEEVYGDVGMATSIFQSNLNIMSRPDSLRAGMVLALPSP